MAVGGNGSRYSTGASIEDGGLVSVEAVGPLSLGNPGLGIEGLSTQGLSTQGLGTPGLVEPALGGSYRAKYEDPDQTIRQLQTALETRVVIEQAKGVLAERFRLSIDDAFRLLRDSARTGRMPLRALAQMVVERSDCTPAEIAASLARHERWQYLVDSASPAA